MIKILLVIIIALVSQTVLSYDAISTDYKKVTLVIVDSTDKLESGFGHAFLRLSKNDNYSSVDDIALEFAANLEGKDVNYLRGIGLGTPYAFEVKPTPYQLLLIDNTQVQERSLNQYELKLSQDEVHRLLENLNEYIVGEKKVTYNFFTRNCSSEIIEILNATLDDDKKITGTSKNVPTLVAQKLKKAGLVKSEFISPSNKVIRAILVEKAFGVISNEINQPLVQNLREELNGDIKERIVAYTKLIKLTELFPEKEKMITDFIKRMASNEHPQIMMDVLRIAKKQYSGKFQLVELLQQSSGRELDADLIEELKKGSFSYGFSIRNGVAHLNIFIQHKCDNANSKGYQDVFTFDHPHLLVSENKNIVELNGHPLFYRGSIASIEKELNDKIVVVPEIVLIEGKYVLRPIIIQDFNNDNKKNLKGIDITNKSDTKNILGMCYGFTLVQKMLMANVFFLPNEEKKSKDYYNEIIEKALQGRQVFAYGVSNLEELTGNADLKKLEQRISDINNENNSFSKLSLIWLKSVKLNPERIYDIQYLAAKGIYTIINFRPLKDQHKLGHTLLIYGVREESERYQLSVYDSNIGLVPEEYTIKYWINKSNMGLSSNYYKNMGKNEIPAAQ